MDQNIKIFFFSNLRSKKGCNFPDKLISGLGFIVAKHPDQTLFLLAFF